MIGLPIITRSNKIGYSNDVSEVVIVEKYNKIGDYDMFNHDMRFIPHKGGDQDNAKLFFNLYAFIRADKDS